MLVHFCIHWKVRDLPAMLSAVNMDKGSVDPGCFIRAQQVDDIGHVSRTGHPAKWIARYRVIEQFLASGYFLHGWRVCNTCLYHMVLIP